MKDNETGELFTQYKYLEILEIASIVDINNYDLMGPTAVSQIKASRMFYNFSSDMTERIPYTSDFEIAVFGYNSTNAPNERFFAGEFQFAPLVLPLNDTGLTSSLPALTNIVNETFYHNVYKMGYINKFNTGGFQTNVKTGVDKIWYKNTTLGYYSNLTYYQNNGTLESADLKFLMWMEEDGDGRWIVIEYELERVFDYDITDDIEWGINVGESYYFGYGDGESNDEIKVDITNITKMNFDFEVFGDWTVQPYQVVWGNKSFWDGSQYIFDDSDVPLGIANNYYPLHPMVLGDSSILPMFYPNNTKFDDWAFTFNNFTHEHWDMDILIHDETILEFIGREDDFHATLNIDNKTGILKLMTFEEQGELEMILFRKNMTILPGAVPNYLELYSDLVGINRVFLNNLTMTDDTELLWAVLPVNPLEPEYGAFKYEIPGLELYIDVYVNDTTKFDVSSNPNITIYYDTQVLVDLGIPESELRVYEWDFDTEMWEEHVGNYTINGNEINITNIDSSYHTIGAEEYWNWSADVFNAKGDILIYESLGKLGGNISEFGGIVQIPYINFAILNITDVGLANHTFSGETQEFNQINTTLMRYNPLIDKLDTAPSTNNKFTLSEYYYNQSRDPGFYLNLTENMLGFPIIIPLRYDQLALPIIGRTLNESFYSSQLAIDMGFPLWDDITVNTLKNILLFNDTTSDYFMELTYYDNGTLMLAEGSTQFTIDDKDIEFNLTSTRVYNWSTTNEVEWGLEVGDSYYFGSNYPEGGPTMEVNITIVHINQSAVYLADLFGFGEGAFMFETWLTFENIWGKMEYWNVTDLGNGIQSGEWVSMDESIFIIAAANNYFPFAPGDYLDYHGFDDTELVPILMPKGTTGYNLTEDYLDYLAMLITEWYEGEVIPVVSSVSDNYLRVDLVAPNYPEYSSYLEWYLDIDTGITRLYYIYEEYEDNSFISATFLKNHTLGLGDETFEYNNYLVPDINITAEIESVGEYDFFEAMLNRNPVNSSMPSGIGTPMFYMDLFYINGTSDSYNLTFIMELPSQYNVNYVNYIVMYFVDYKTGEGHWVSTNVKDIPVGTVTKDYQNNILILRIENMNGSVSSILAWMYTPPGAVSDDGGGGGGSDKDTSPEVPGYDPYLLMAAIFLLSIIVVIKRRKKIRI